GVIQEPQADDLALAAHAELDNLVTVLGLAAVSIVHCENLQPKVVLNSSLALSTPRPYTTRRSRQIGWRIFHPNSFSPSPMLDRQLSPKTHSCLKRCLETAKSKQGLPVPRPLLPASFFACANCIAVFHVVVVFVSVEPATEVGQRLATGGAAFQALGRGTERRGIPRDAGMNHLEHPELPGDIQADACDHGACEFRPAGHNQAQALLLGRQGVLFGIEIVRVFVGLEKPAQVCAARADR